MMSVALKPVYLATRVMPIAIPVNVMIRGSGGVRSWIVAFLLAKKMNVVHARASQIRSAPMEPPPVSESVSGVTMGPVDGLEQNVRLSVSPVMRSPISMVIAAFATVLASMNVSATVMDQHPIVNV